MTAAVVALAAALAGAAAALVTALWKWATAESRAAKAEALAAAAAGEVALAHDKVRAMAADRDAALALAAALEELLDENDLPIPAGGGARSLRVAVLRDRATRARAPTAPADDPPVPRVSGEGPAPAAGDGGSLAGFVPGGRA